MRRLEHLTLVLMLDVNHTDPPASGVDTDGPTFYDLHIAPPGRFEHHHSELLGAEPAGAPRVRYRNRLGREIGTMPADQARTGEDVRAGQRNIEPAFRRRRISTLRRIVKPSSAPAMRLGRLRHGLEKRDLGRIGGREHVATTVEI